MSIVRNVNGVNLRNFTDSTTVTQLLSTSENIVGSILVPANTFRAGDLITLEAMFFKSNDTGNFTCRYYYNTTNSLAGAVLIQEVTSVSNIIKYIHLYRRLYIIQANGGGTGSELGTELLGTSQSDDLRLNSGFLSGNLSINWTNDVYIICSLQNTSTNTATSKRFLKLWTY
jgi:hypothetical protein